MLSTQPAEMPMHRGLNSFRRAIGLFELVSNDAAAIRLKSDAFRSLKLCKFGLCYASVRKI
ncbi:hypothetical protein SAMN04487925_1011426 [Bradyrhizobium sp. cf659]|nr:hypothetical protein SAMN04487925_1011426 [Bradyrhizobium sp. cf659]